MDTTKQNLLNLGGQNLVREGLIVLLLILAIWLPRGFSLDRFVSTDEIPWLVRSANFYYALSHLDFERTFQKEHPGVTTMWVNTVAFLIEHPEYRALDQAGIVKKGQFDSFLTFERFADAQEINSHAILVTGRSFMVVIHTILLILCYFLARRLIGFLPALIGILLLSLEPFYIGLTRLSHLDGLVGTLSLVSVLAFMVYAFEDQKLRYLIVSAIAASLASLTKITGFIILPGLSLIIIFMIIFHKRGSLGENRRQFLIWIRKIAGHLLLFGAVFILIYFVFWPAMWVNPVGTLTNQFLFPEWYLSGTSFESVNQQEVDPIPIPDLNNEIFRYPEKFLWRVTPVSLAGLLLWLFFFIMKKDILFMRKIRWVSWSLLAFIFTFTVLLSIPEKFNFRYWIPAYLSLLLLAGIGWAALMNTVMNRFPENYRKRVGFLLIIGVVLIQFYGISRTYPYYFTYFNPILGGSKRAGESISVGEGEGLDLAGQYLSSLPDAENMTVMSWYGWGSFSYYFSGSTIVFPVTNRWSKGLAEKLSDSDYLVVYQNQWYRRIPSEVFDSLDQVKPMKTIWLDDIEYVRIYEVESLPDQIFTP